MDQTALIEKVEALETQLIMLQKANKKEYNSDVVYNTKDTMGYSQLVETTGGKVFYLSGMTPWSKEMKLPGLDIKEQMEHALDNLFSLLASKELTKDNIVSIRFYVAKPNYYEHIEDFKEVMNKRLGKYFESALTLVGVTGLAEPDQLVEVEAIAVA